MTEICKEEELPAESEVAAMVLRHRITINVTDPHGRSARVLKGAEMRLPSRLVKLLFGDFTQVYLLAPGQSVDSVDIRELREGGDMDGKNE